MADILVWDGREIPVLGRHEVLVCGGGPAGFAAAVASARNGTRTMMLERHGFPGGMASAGMVNPIYGFFARHIQIVTGIPQELIDRLAQIPGGTAGHEYRHDCVARREQCGECITGVDEAKCPVASVANVCPVDSEAVKLVALQMVDESGSEWCLHTHIVDVLQEGDRVTGVITYGKSGFGAYLADLIIDATGDADIAALSGAPFQAGSDEDGATKPPTLMFRIGNVKLTKDRVRAKLPEDIAEKAGGTWCWLMALPREGEYTVNSPSGLVGFDATRTDHLSHAQAETTRQVFLKLDGLRRNLRGCENAELLSIAPHLGLRDSRRIVGEYTLTEEDVLTSRKHPEGIANGVHPIDLHTGSPKHEGRNLIKTPCGDYYQIPFGCLIPKRIENLLVAGRSISSTFQAQGSARVMATCMGVGQAAGTAASICTKRGESIRKIDISELRDTLIEQGTYLGRESDVPTWNMGHGELPEPASDGLIKVV
jgi:hypothetical protein